MLKHKIGLAVLIGGLIWGATAAAQDTSNRIEYGAFVAGAIADNGGINVWEFEATAGDVVWIDLQSDDFDPVVEVFFEDELVFEDDDSGYYSNAYLVTEPLVSDGVYQIFVKSAFDSDGGEYFLWLDGAAVTAIEDGLLFNAMSPAVMSDENVDVWPLTLEDDAQLYVSVLSPRQDLLATIATIDGQVIAQDDDSGGDLNPLLTDVVLAAGAYRLVIEPATSGDASGSFYMVGVFTGADGDPIGADSVERGVLLAGDEAARWTFTATGGEAISILARSEFFDTVLTVIDPSGAVLASDDDSAADFQAALLAVVFDEPGDYEIVVSSFGTTSGGPYELRVLSQ